MSRPLHEHGRAADVRVHAGEHEPSLDARAGADVGARAAADDDDGDLDARADRDGDDDRAVHPPAQRAGPGPCCFPYAPARRSSRIQCLTYWDVAEGVGLGVGACGASDHPSEFLIQHGDNAAIYVPGTNLYVPSRPLHAHAAV
jgi:hypothetical protein